MNKLSSIKCAAVLLPVLAMGMPMANASEEKCECPCGPERTTAAFGSDREYERAEQHTSAGRTSMHDASSPSSDANDSPYNSYLGAMPDRGYHSDRLVGHDVMNRRNNKSIGTVSNLLLDEHGQVVALIVGVGGIMGMGQRDLAIAWDQVERKLDGDDITLSVDLTETSLKDAPKYARR